MVLLNHGRLQQCILKHIVLALCDIPLNATLHISFFYFGYRYSPLWPYAHSILIIFAIFPYYLWQDCVHFCPTAL